MERAKPGNLKAGFFIIIIGVLPVGRVGLAFGRL
jgi:hypothetical protein